MDFQLKVGKKVKNIFMDTSFSFLCNPTFGDLKIPNLANYPGKFIEVIEVAQ